PHPELQFERGWALLREGRFEQARVALEEYEAAHPGRGKTAELLGRVYTGLGEYEAAEQQFAEALRRDPGLAGTVAVGRAALVQRLRRPEGVRRRLAAAVGDAAEQPSRDTLAERVLRAESPAPRPCALRVGAGLGYTPHARGLADNAPRGPGVPEEDDEFLRL